MLNGSQAQAEEFMLAKQRNLGQHMTLRINPKRRTQARK